MSSVIECRKGKSFTLATDDIDREPVCMKSCRNCKVMITFNFHGDRNLKDGYAKWMSLPKQERKTQHFIYDDCEEVHITEEQSLHAHFSFIDCRNCSIKLTNSTGSVHVVNCDHVKITAPAASSIHIFKSIATEIDCNTVCQILEVSPKPITTTTTTADKTTNVITSVNRRWDLEAIMDTEKFREALQMIELREDLD